MTTISTDERRPCEPLIYYSLKYNIWVTATAIIYNDIFVPVGFKSNLVSLPWFLRLIINSYGRYNRASIVHDYCYSIRKLSRKQCDKAFLEIMLADTVNYYLAHAMYYSVRVFGWFYFYEFFAILAILVTLAGCATTVDLKQYGKIDIIIDYELPITNHQISF